MVNSEGQLFTIEGIAASLIILMTAYIVVNSTSVYTPGDTHISNMQLEVLGSDALTMLNTPQSGAYLKSPLQEIVEQNDAARFSTMFNDTVNRRAGNTQDKIQFLANVTYVTKDGVVNNTLLSASSRALRGGEHAVRVSEWVIIEKNQFPGPNPLVYQNRKHAALVEVLLWRD